MPVRYQSSCSLDEVPCTTFSGCNPCAITYNEAVDQTASKDPLVGDWSEIEGPVVESEQPAPVAKTTRGLESVDLTQLWTTLGAETKTLPEAKVEASWLCLRPLPRNWHNKVQNALQLAQHAEQTVLAREHSEFQASMDGHLVEGKIMRSRTTLKQRNCIG
mmetsp:Transcript_27398/g.63279  ORF Transcript_27398/g.63279 Transcript_27398/m.63279 type:complete len:161 (+) Transcript_27398:79-561(+)